MHSHICCALSNPLRVTLIIIATLMVLQSESENFWMYVQVTCGPVTRRGKRAVDVQSRSGEDWMERVQASQRRRRSPASHYVLVTFHMQIHVLDSPQSAESAYQVISKDP